MRRRLAFVFLLLSSCGGGGKVDFPHGFALQPTPPPVLVPTPFPVNLVVPFVEVPR